MLLTCIFYRSHMKYYKPSNKISFMPKLGDIAHISGRDVDGDKDAVRIIMDTSALIAWEHREFWIPENFSNVLEANDVIYRVLLFEMVRRELDYIHNNQTKDDFGMIKLSTSPDKIYERLQKNQINSRVGTFNIPKGLHSIVNDNYVSQSKKYLGGRTLSDVDSYIVGAAYQYAIRGITSVVLTSDSHIFDVLTDMKKKDNGLPIVCVSPFNLRKKHGAYMDGQLLITDELMSKIMHLSTESTINYYINVEKRQWRPRNSKDDFFINHIAHDLLRVSPYTKMPVKDGIHYYPLVLMDRNKYTDRSYERLRRMQEGDILFHVIKDNPPIVDYVIIQRKYAAGSVSPTSIFSCLRSYRIGSNFLNGVEYASSAK